MKVSYSEQPPQFDGGSLSINFAVTVDGTLVLCSISAEALEDHFGAHSALEEDLIKAFEQGRARIRSVCTTALEVSGGAPVVLRSGLFRIG
jgi:hypothetical protein